MKTFRRMLATTMAGVVCLLVSSSLVMTAYALSPGAVGSWSASTNLPSVVYGGTTVLYNGYVYVIGGLAVGELNTVYSAPLNSNGSVGTWTLSSSTLPTATWGSTATVYNGYVYVIGGQNSVSSTNTVYYAQLGASGTIGAWSTSSNLLPQTLLLANSTAYDGYLYAIDGQGGSGLSATTYSAPINANGSIGSWTAATNTLPQAIWQATSVTYDGYIYVMGGLNNSGYTATVYSAPLGNNGTIGTWTTATNSLPAVSSVASAVVYNGYVFVLGGNANASRQNTVFSALLSSSGSVGTWTSATNTLPETVEEQGSVAYNGYVYVIGGDNAGNDEAVYYAPVMGAATPVLVPQTTSLVSGSSVTVDVLTGASGDPDPASLQITSQPAHGTATDPPGTITYTPNKGYVGTDSLVYEVCSLADESICSQATLTFDVTAAAPDTGFAVSQSRPLDTLAIYGLAAACLTAVALLGRKYVTRRSR